MLPPLPMDRLGPRALLMLSALVSNAKRAISCLSEIGHVGAVNKLFSGLTLGESSVFSGHTQTDQSTLDPFVAALVTFHSCSRQDLPFLLHGPRRC